MNVTMDLEWVLFFLLIILCVGEPDLIDGLVHYLMEGSSCE